jgi:hypothetical protein
MSRRRVRRAVRWYLEAVATTVEAELDEQEQLLRGVPSDDLRDAFVACARVYAERHCISYASWRAVGVDRATLHAAGIRP